MADTKITIPSAGNGKSLLVDAGIGSGRCVIGNGGSGTSIGFFGAAPRAIDGVAETIFQMKEQIAQMKEKQKEREANERTAMDGFSKYLRDKAEKNEQEHFVLYNEPEKQYHRGYEVIKVPMSPTPLHGEPCSARQAYWDAYVGLWVSEKEWMEAESNRKLSKLPSLKIRAFTSRELEEGLEAERLQKEYTANRDKEFAAALGPVPVVKPATKNLLTFWNPDDKQNFKELP